MSLLNFLKRDNISDRYAISLDIGTEFVKSLIFKVEGERAIVKGVGRQRQKLSDMAGGAVTDIGGVIKNCESAISQAAEQAKIMPSQVIIGIAGELVKGTTTIIRYVRPNSREKIDLGELKDIIARVQRRAFDRARQLLAWETGQEEIDVRLVNAAITEVRIDGYKVTNPIGFQGKEVQVGVFNAFAPIVHLGALQTIAEDLDLDLLSIAAEPYSVARCLDPEETVEMSAIFIDIGGGTTDIAVVRGGGVEGTKMFALGGRAFTKRIAVILGKSFREAEGIKMRYSHGELKETEEMQVKKALASDCQVWLSGVEMALSEFSRVDLFPGRILLCGGGSALPEIKESLENFSWRRLPFSRKPSVHFIKPSDLTTIIDDTNELKNPKDVTPMALANLAIDLVGKTTIIDSVLSKVIRNVTK